jgi:HEAT repeats
MCHNWSALRRKPRRSSRSVADLRAEPRAAARNPRTVRAGGSFKITARRPPGFMRSCGGVTGPDDPARPDIAALAAAADRDGLRAALGHDQASIRARACDALAQLEDLGAAPLLRRMLRTDDDDHVREEAAVALGRLGDPNAIDGLVAALQRDRSQHVREEAAVALGALGDPRTIDVLVSAMEDRHTMVQRAAAEALHRFGPHAVDRLVALAQGPRKRAAKAAGAALRALEELRPGAHWPAGDGGPTRGGAADETRPASTSPSRPHPGRP